MKNTHLPWTMALVFSASVQAEVYQQPKSVVTVSRYEQSREDVIPSVSVISREDILNLQANSVLELLNLQPGIDVARSGGLGTVTSVFIRGTNSNHSLVLINGVRASSNITGTYAWEHLPVSQIERIEIVRGSRVSYYGADAIGGVINIITRQQDNFYVRATTGSYKTHGLDLGIGTSNEKAHVSLVLGGQKSEGFSATNASNTFAYNPDDDGYENYNANLRTGIKIGEGQLNLDVLAVKGEVEFDSFFNVGSSKVEENITKLSWANTLFNDWSSELVVSWNNSEIDTKVFSNGSESERTSFEWLLNKELNPNHHLGLGLTYRDDEIELNHSLVNALNYEESSNNSAVFVNWLGQFEKNHLTASARYDDNKVYGGDTSADLGWAHLFNDNVKLNLSVGSAFKAPNMVDLYSKYFQVIIFSPEVNEFVSFFSYEGNPDLKPEEALNYELGLSTNWGENQRLDVDLFYYDIENLVDYQGSTFKPVNVQESTIKGVEVDYNLSLDSLRFNINATVQDAKNDTTGDALLRRPDNKVNVNLDKYFDKFSLGGSLRYASESKDFGTKLDSYTVLDLRAAYQINPQWRLALKLENVADEDYQIVNGYNTPGASAYFTVEWQNQ